MLLHLRRFVPVFQTVVSRLIQLQCRTPAPQKSDLTLQNSRRLLTPEQQNLDVLSTFSGRKYGHLDIIQNPDPVCLTTDSCTCVATYS